MSGSFSARMRQLRRLRYAPAEVPSEQLDQRARTDCGRLLYKVSDGNVVWWVQATSCFQAGRLVRQAMREQGCAPEEISAYFRSNLSIMSQTWRQGASTSLADSPGRASVLSLFVGGRDEILACSEW